MKYYELRVSVYLNHDIKLSNSYELIAKLINFSFNNSQELSCLHKRSGLKQYSFSGLYPIEKDYIYKSDEIYSFIIRSYSIQFIKKIARCLDSLENNDFIVTIININNWYHKKINYVDNLTPTIITLKNGLRWNKDNDGQDIANISLFNNLIKKYNKLNKTNITCKYEDIIKNITIKNKCPIIINYKGIKFLGYKFRIKFQQNSIAQEIANLSVVEGIGEKNSSFGMGFVKPYFV